MFRYHAQIDWRSLRDWCEVTGNSLRGFHFLLRVESVLFISVAKIDYYEDPGRRPEIQIGGAWGDSTMLGAIRPGGSLGHQPGRFRCAGSVGRQHGRFRRVSSVGRRLVRFRRGGSVANVHDENLPFQFFKTDFTFSPTIRCFKSELRVISGCRSERPPYPRPEDFSIKM